MRQHRLASREQLLTRQDAEAASQVAEAQAAAAAAYSRARQDLHHEYKSQREALANERQALDADRCVCCQFKLIACLQTLQFDSVLRCYTMLLLAWPFSPRSCSLALLHRTCSSAHA